LAFVFPVLVTGGLRFVFTQTRACSLQLLGERLVRENNFLHRGMAVNCADTVAGRSTQSDRLQKSKLDPQFELCPASIARKNDERSLSMLKRFYCPSQYQSLPSLLMYFVP
jgi:hypothetical protein